MSSIDTRARRHPAWLVGGGAVSLGLVLLLAGVLGGFVPVPGVTTGQTRPPCSSLPPASEVQAAVTQNEPVTRALREAVPGARVTVGEPCDGTEADRGIVSISVPDREAADAVSTWLGKNDGYGVPVEVTKR